MCLTTQSQEICEGYVTNFISEPTLGSYKPFKTNLKAAKGTMTRVIVQKPPQAIFVQ